MSGSGSDGAVAPTPAGDGSGAARPVPPGVRWVAVVIVVAAVATLIGARLGSGDSGRPAGDAASTTTTATTTPGDRTGEPALPEPPSKLTRAELGGIHFTDVTKAAGLLETQSNVPLTAERAMTSGAAVADVDGDGRPDIYVTRVGRPNSLYHNNGDGTFTDIAAEAGVTGPGGVPGAPSGSGSAAAAFVDLDGTGAPDLYVTGAGPSPDELFINDGHGHFTDQLAARGLAQPPPTPPLGSEEHSVSFGDYDHDGHLDLLVLHWDPAFLGGQAAGTASESIPNPASTCQKEAEIRRLGGDRTAVAGANRSRLFHNDGHGHFTDVTAAMGLPLDQIAAFTGQFADVDGDGWPDLVITGDFCTSRIFHNDGGHRFVDVTDTSKVGTDENGMGSVVRDVNGDGRPDWFISSISLRTASGKCVTRLANSGCSGNRLYLQRPDGTFTDATDSFGVRDGGWGWGAAIEDFGNDGRLEVAQTNGYVQTGSAFQGFRTDRTRFWVPTGHGEHHEDGAALAGIDDRGVGHALVAFDMDGDGDLDLLIANYGSAPRLYRNDTPRSRHWLTVRLDDPAHPGNRQGIGAKVVVSRGRSVGTSGTAAASVTGWIDTGGSYESEKPPVLHVGLARNGAPVRVEVWWPGDAEPQVVPDVRPDQVVTITRPPG